MNDSMTLTFTDILHPNNHSADIASYQAFSESEVAASTASNITMNLTNLSDGTMRLFIDEDYVYTNNHNAREAVFTGSGATNATSYDINLTVAAVRGNVTHMPFNSSGTLNVTIRYTDLNGTAVEHGSVFPGESSQFQVDYLGGYSVQVEVGPNGGNNGSLRMKASGISVDTAWAVVLPPLDAAKKRGYEYDATISYVQGKVAKRSRLGK
jgi:hypothetical protein